MNKITYISYKIQSNLDHYLLLSSMHSNSISTYFPYFKSFPNGSAGKDLPAMQETQEMWVWSLGWEDPLEKEMQPTLVFLPEKPHGQRSLAGCSPKGFLLFFSKELDTTEQLRTYRPWNILKTWPRLSFYPWLLAQVLAVFHVYFLALLT